jgi:hypothetical protein
MLRYLRIAVTPLAVFAGCVLIAMWVRSYNSNDLLIGPDWNQGSLVAASKQGRLALIRLDLPTRRPWSAKRAAVNGRGSFPYGSMREYESFLGFGIIRDPKHMVSHQSRLPSMMAALRHRWTMPSPTTITYKGAGVIIPYWFLIFLVGVVAATPRIGWPPRISMRGLLIVMTFASFLLGLVAAMDLRGLP